MYDYILYLWGSGANHRVCLLYDTFPGGIVTRQILVVSVDRM